MMHDLWPYVAALIPFLGGAAIFYVILRNVMRSDHNEREARRAWAAQHPGSRIRPGVQGNPPSSAPQPGRADDNSAGAP